MHTLALDKHYLGQWSVLRVVVWVEWVVGGSVVGYEEGPSPMVTVVLVAAV